MTIKAGLSAQRKVAELLSDGNWYSVASIAKSTGLGAEPLMFYTAWNKSARSSAKSSADAQDTAMPHKQAA